MIQLKNLSIGYQQPIAQNLNLHVAQGGISALLGANGCGKTTLLKTILGLLPVHQGEILIKNTPHLSWSKAQLAQLIAYVPQAHPALFAFNVLDIVLMGRSAHLAWYQTPQAQDKQIAKQSLANLGIEHLAAKNYNALSGGERQLVLIARALAQQAQCLILDEPTSNLDFSNQIKVLEHIQQLAQQGLSILFTTHQPEQALRYAQRSILFYRGNILAQGASESVINYANLAQIYQLDTQVLAKNLALNA